MGESYCKWHDKKTQDVAEYEQEQCWDYGWDCRDCPYYVDSEDDIGQQNRRQ